MIAIGITQSKLLPELFNPAPYGTLVDRTIKTRNTRNGWGGAGIGHRYAATVYKAVQGKNLSWYWKPAGVQCETRSHHVHAVRDAQVLSEQNGQCRIYTFGLGNRKIT